MSAFFPSAAAGSSYGSAATSASSSNAAAVAIARREPASLVGPGFKFPSSRRYLWDRTAAASPILIDCKVGGRAGGRDRDRVAGL
jgi:hypothetical protein